MECIIFIGIQASGKSEFCKQYFYKTHIRINLDMLKTRHRERLLIDACLKAKQPFVIDNTNPETTTRLKYIDKAKAYDFKVIGYYFSSEIKQALLRNEQRTGKEKLKPAAICVTHKKLELPKYDEGYDELKYVRIGENFSFIVEDYNDEI